jgi:hypothetical protein
MNRNSDFYERYLLRDYYKDYLGSKLKYFSLFVNNFESEILIDCVDDSTKKILIIGMGFGREIDIIGKITDHIQIDVVDFSRDFIEFGTRWYKNVNFYRRDLNLDKIALNNSYDLIISFNTLEYLNDSAFVKVISEIKSMQKPSGKFIFRILSANFLQRKRIVKELNHRANNMPIYFLRKIPEVVNILNYKNIKLIKSPIKFDGYLFDILYIYFWPTFSYLERIIRLIIPLNKCRSVYFICSDD